MSERTGRVWRAGDFWAFGDPSLGLSGPASVHEQIAAGIERARKALAERGIDETPGDPAVALAGVEAGSVEEVALGVVAWGRACQAMISAASPSALSARLAIGDGEDRAKAAAWEAHMTRGVGECASIAISFGARLAILNSMLGDLTDEAKRGRGVKAQLRTATELAAAKARARTDPLRQAAAAYIRSKDFSPTLSLSAVARAVAEEDGRSEKDVRDAIRGLFQPRAPGSKEYAPCRSVIERDYPAG